MQFSTQVPIPKSNHPIDYSSGILSLGSCFAENIGDKFDYFKFQNSVNPFGIIFNPVSIEKLVQRAVNQQFFTENDIFSHNGLWHCYEVHSELNHSDKEVFLNHLNALVSATHYSITKATHIIITYGTSWVYRLKSSGEVVANCHKMPQKEFYKEILLVETIQKSIQNTIDFIQKINPDCHFIFTISPVRHLKDGFAENQRSKAHLIAAIHETINHQPLTINYFPSYEIVMDELRDYRFYNQDMLHPNQTAINYIWECFSENYIAPTAYPIMEEVDAIQKALGHRPFNPNTESHQKFLSNINQKISALQEQLPHFKF